MKFKHLIPAFVWALCIFVLSAIPGSKVPKNLFDGIDKIVHACIYALLSFLILYAGYKQLNTVKIRFNWKLYSFICCFIYGGFMELLQEYIFIRRSGDWYDVLANSIGALMGILFFPFMLKLLPIKR